MRQFQLFGQIPEADEQRVLNLLTTATGQQQPSPLCEQHLIYSRCQPYEMPPLPPPPSMSAKKAGKQPVTSPPQPERQDQQAQDPPRVTVQLFRNLNAREDSSIEQGLWRLLAEHAPNPAETEVLTRSTFEQVPSDMDLQWFGSAEWYRLETNTCLLGHRFTLKPAFSNDSSLMDIKLYRAFADATATADPRAIPPPTADAVRAVDPNGAWTLVGTVRTPEGSRRSLKTKAQTVLLHFKGWMAAEGVQMFVPACLDAGAQPEAKQVRTDSVVVPEPPPVESGEEVDQLEASLVWLEEMWRFGGA